MPSHFGNWMKQERKTIKARNKAMENYLKLGAVTSTVNYKLVKENIMEDVFNRCYKVLTDKQKEDMSAIKEKAHELYEIMDQNPASREMALAKTNLEQAVMWAVKAVTK